MDCEKFEPLLLDELYEELDELTSAAVKRHVSGCARCAAKLNSMRSTRRAAVLPLVPLPAGLEDRILAAAKEAQKVVPIRSRLSRALSHAGTWAMRPQTAMAAVFLFMIGTGTFLVRSKTHSSRDSSVSVTVQGAPSPTTPALATAEAIDDKAAAAAHGPSTPNAAAPPPPPPAATFAFAGDETNGPLGGLAAGAGHDKGKNDNALGALSAPATKAAKEEEGEPIARIESASNAAAPAGAPPADLAQAPGKLQANQGGQTNRQLDMQQGQDPFSLGIGSYRARNYAEATRQFDLAAQSGDVNAALWAARSTKEGNGCALALGRFERVAQTASSAWHASEASLEAAKCQIAMGQLEPARERLTKLTQVASHRAPAQQALNDLDQMAARRQAGGGGAAGRAAPAAPARAAAPPPAPKPAAGTQSGSGRASEKKASEADQAHSY